jgi:hypothetical protein
MLVLGSLQETEIDINTKQAHKVATSTGYIGYNNADIAGQWSKLE